MRIIAGELRGRVLAPVQGRTRPTAAKVREAIFNILGPVVPEAQVLDLFAGTGALGIEALSRGAAQAVFVEDHPGALKALRRNLETLGLQDRSRVLPLPVAAALRQLAAQGERFGLVFLDPPYGGEAAAATLGALAGSSLLLTEVWVVAEHSRREKHSKRETIDAPESGGTGLVSAKRYGDTCISIFTLHTSNKGVTDET
ncbi:MAG: 16S rRNA (guanine(966)-N(2))-methyltransferase RsmD [Deltaproteobacteria bacterium]|nr:16S rRNA (guanine(966)-N(2))-methyltransferase RsmD [Deltaproteobacteria bacterium]